MSASDNTPPPEVPAVVDTPVVPAAVDTPVVPATTNPPVSSSYYTSSPSSSYYTSSPSSSYYTSSPSSSYYTPPISSSIFIPNTKEEDKVKPFVPPVYNSKKKKPLSAIWIAIIVICALGVAALIAYAFKSMRENQTLLKENNISIPSTSAQKLLERPTHVNKELPALPVHARNAHAHARPHTQSHGHGQSHKILPSKRFSPRRKGLSLSPKKFK